jgi:3-hydroxyisobutyrate dehydrogenase-like beta-hydroxyacid dehydrogenase
VLSLTTAAEAEGALRQSLRGCARTTVYADANTASAGHKQHLAAIASNAGLPFADIAIMAPVPGLGHRVPMLVSGPGAQHTGDILAECGASIEILPGPAGLAATRKLLRSIFYKGMAAAAVEALRAARAAGCEDWLRQHLAEELASADAATLERLESGSYRHALRRSHEMAAAAEMLAELGVPPRIANASRQWLDDLA